MIDSVEMLEPYLRAIVLFDGEVMTDGGVLERLQGILEENCLMETEAYKIVSAPRKYEDEGMVLDEFIDCFLIKFKNV